MLTPEQIEQRRSLLTASDAAAVLGLSPYKTAAQVWREKVERANGFAENWRMRRGHAIEPLLLAWLGEQRAPLEVRPAGDVTRVHPKHPWLGATVDGLALRDGKTVAICEAKSTESVAHWTNEHGEAQTPDYYFPQVTIEMAVVGVPLALVVAEVMPREPEPIIIDVERDEAFEAVVIERLEYFWHKHVLEKVPPLDGATYEDIASIYRRPVRPHQIATSPEADRQATRYLRAREIARKADAAADAAKAALCALIGENEGITAPEWRATWKLQAARHVEAYDTKPFRRFDLRRKGTR